MKIYIACGLTHVPKDVFSQYADFICELANTLANLGHDIKYALRDSDPQLCSHPESEKARLCYQWDRDMVLWADLVVADCSFPSTGLGIELQIAEGSGKATMLMCASFLDNKAEDKTYMIAGGDNHHLQIGNGYITLMALGLPSVKSVIMYPSFTNGIDQCTERIVAM